MASLLNLFYPRFLRQARRKLKEKRIRAKCCNAYLGDNVALCRVLGRFKMFVDTRDVGLTPHLLTDGFWEMPTTDAISSLVRPGMVAVDLGANLGYFTLLMARLVGTSGHVHAFEPNPAMAKMLTDSVEINGFRTRTTIHPIALGERRGEVGFFIPPDQPKNAQIVPLDYPGSEKVQVERFDAIADLSEADFIKIDVEGAEEAIWEGMAELLEGNRALTIVLEFTPARYVDTGAFLSKISSSGFSLSLIDSKDGIIPTTHNEVLDRPPHEDQLLVLQRS